MSEHTNDDLKKAPTARRSGRLGLMLCSGALALACAAVAIFGGIRERPVTERIIPASLLPPTVEQQAAADQALRLTGSLEERLTVLIASLDPPLCRPGDVVDPQRLSTIRTAESDNITRWRRVATADRGVGSP